MELDQYLTDQNGTAEGPLEWAFHTGVQLLRANRASLMLRDRVESVLAVVAAVGLDPAIWPSIRVPIGEGIAGLVAERGALLFGSRNEKTFLSVPIITERGVEGVLNLTERAGGEQFGEEHVEPATLIAAHLARLLDYSRRTIPELESGLPGRAGFELILDRELARSNRLGYPFALASIGLELRSLDGRSGQANPEEVVRSVAEALRRMFRRYDLVSYFGGNEIFVLMAGPIESDSGIARRIGDAVAGIAGQMGVDITIAVGVARCPADSTNATDLLAKATGRMQENRRVRGLPL